jgi:hypothetical protein
MTEPRTAPRLYLGTDINLKCFTVAEEIEPGAVCEICGRPAEWTNGPRTRYLCLFHRLLWSVFLSGWMESYEETTGKEKRLGSKWWNHAFDRFVASIKRNY